MTVPFGFSISDFITGINLAKNFVHTLKAQGGAVEQYQHLLEQLHHDCRILSYFGLLNLPQEYASLDRDIVQQANLLYHSAQHFLKAIDQYRDEFNKVGANKFYHGVRSKAKWFLAMEKKIKEYRKDVEVKRGGLPLLTSRLTM